jgi:hypothetical protein
MNRVLIISFSNLGSDPRVDRQIAALRTRYRIVAAGLGAPRNAVEEFVDISTRPRSKLGRSLGLARLLARRYEAVYWKHPTNIEVLERLRHVSADVVIANDLPALPLALRLGLPVVFDAHEHAPSQEADRLAWRVVMAPYVRWQCRRYIPQVSAMTTQGQAHADAYERETGIRATVVTNAPQRHDLEPSPVHQPVRILHHGGAQGGRGLEEMIRLAGLVDERFTLDFVLVENWPGYRDKLIRAARHNPRVRFPEPRPMHELVRMANDYDIGLFLLPPVNFHRRYALPNKFFEFVQARLAVAIGPSPEMARLVHQYGCGIVADDFAPETLAAALNALDASAIAALKRASDAAADELCAENNAELILGAVEGALAHPAPRA